MYFLFDSFLKLRFIFDSVSFFCDSGESFFSHLFWRVWLSVKILQTLWRPIDYGKLAPLFLVDSRAGIGESNWKSDANLKVALLELGPQSAPISEAFVDVNGSKCLTWRRVRDTTSLRELFALTILISFWPTTKGREMKEERVWVMEWDVLAGQFNFFATRVSSGTRVLSLASATDLPIHS